MQMKLFEALGGKPVTLSYGEFYLGLQTGLIDGGWTGIASGYGIKIYEVVKYASRWPFGNMGPWAICVRKDTFESLPKDLQVRVKEVMNSLTKDAAAAVIKEQNEVIGKLREGELEVRMEPENKTDIERVKQKAIPLIKEWLERCKTRNFEIGPVLRAHMQEKGILMP